jgi:hypothetical protein
MVKRYGRSCGGWGNGPYYDYGPRPEGWARYGWETLHRAGGDIRETDVAVRVAWDGQGELPAGPEYCWEEE